MNTDDGILKAGDLLNNTYEIEELVGQGGTGEVYLAKNIISGRKFAIKILKQEFANNETFINLMRRESDVLHEVRDDAVVRYNELLRSELHGGFVFLVMEYIEGPQLAEIIKERGSIDEASLLMVAKRMGQGLKAAHDKKAFHRDMSPDNIILPGGDMSKAKLIDFGIARDLNENAQTVVGGGFAGKYQYASPEQMDGNVDARSDLYSLGMTLLRAYRGQPIHVGSSLMEIVKSKSVRPDTRDVPGKLGVLITRLVEPQPEDRFQSADEMLAFLAGGGAVAAAPMDEATIIAPQTRQRQATQMPTSLPPEPGSKSGGGGKWVFVVFLLAAIGGGGWYFGVGPGKGMIFGSQFERQSPFIIEIASDAGSDRIRISGHVSGPEQAVLLADEVQQGFAGFTVETALTNASGAPNERWERIAATMVRSAAPLSFWRFEMIDEIATLSGEANSESTAQAVRESFEAAAALVDITVSTEISVAEQPLVLGALNEELSAFQSCGPLRVTGGNGVVANADDRLTVSGIIARQSDVEVIDLVLQELVDGRGIDYNLAVLNGPVCMIESMLPSGPSNGMEIVYSYGNKAGLVDDGVYYSGENPVIDVRFPANRIGFFYGFYIDAEGQVFHLMPHKDRPNNVLPGIGVEQNGLRSVRLAFPADEATTEKLGFSVIEPYGTSMIVAVVSDIPLFDGLRPRAESVEAFRDALAGAQGVLNDGRSLVASRYLVTEQ
ncbi:MAG: serine/threonine-protein kinase [Rhodobacteraceae bacterium]|nr:serine/threonine-protein kinase [Paracoccaceae bacterium]